MINANKDAVRYVGVEVETDLFENADATLNLSDIVGVGQITKVIVNITVSTNGEAANLTPPSDSTDDGLADDDAKNLMTVNYYDRNQLVRNLY